MNVSVKIDNLPQIKKAFQASPSLTKKYLDMAIEKSIYDVQAEAIPRTPVNNGPLRASLLAGITLGTLYGEIFPNIEYAFWVHEITRNRHAVGEAKFLENAMNAQEGNIKNNFEDAMEKVAEEIARRAR